MTGTTLWKSLAAAAVAAVVLAGCADPTPATGGTSSTDDASPTSSGSRITKTWNLKPVDSVAALVPAEFKNKPVNNAIYNDFPPEEFLEGGTLVGIQPDIALAVSEVMGVKLNNISVGTFDSLIPGTVSGRYDLSSGDFGVTADRLKQVDFVTEFPIGTSFAVKKGSGVTINKATDLCGHTVGLQSGSYFIDQLKTANEGCAKAGLGAIKVQTFPDDGSRTLAVTNGRVEVTATAQDALAYSIQSQKLPLELQTFVYQPVEQAIVIPKGSGLGPAVAAAMKEILSNGTYARILQKWGVEKAAYTAPTQVKYLTKAEQAS